MKAKVLLPILLMVLFALTRWPGCLPQNFSAAYALIFCAGVYFPKRLAWWLPLVTMFATDLVLNWHYHAPLLGPEMIGNYLAYVGILGLSRLFSPRSSWVSLLGGGFLGAIIFYLISNTASWWFNTFQAPEYTKTLSGWITALTMGTAGFPHTWEFFRNTFLSGGLFAGLFAGAMKLDAATEPEPKEAPEESPEEEPSSGEQQEPAGAAGR